MVCRAGDHRPGSAIAIHRANQKKVSDLQKARWTMTDGIRCYIYQFGHTEATFSSCFIFPYIKKIDMNGPVRFLVSIYYVRV